MPGIAGFTSKFENTPSEILESMISRLGIGTPADSIESVIGPSFAIATDNRPHGLWGPRVASDEKGITVGINGEVFGLYDADNQPIDNFKRGPDSSPAGELIKLYHRYGLSCIPRLRGFFSIVIWDAVKETLFLITDRYALRSLYYLPADTGIYFGSEVKVLLQPGKKHLATDNHGITEFLLMGMPLGDRTFFKEIKIIPPATIVKIKNGKEEREKYWNLRFDYKNKTLKKRVIADKYFTEAFDNAVADCLEDPIDFYELPLSGGLDSRCIAAGIQKTSNLRSYTMGDEGSKDLDLGIRIAKDIGIPNTPCKLSAIDFIKWIEPSVYITDGMYSPINASIMPIASILSNDSKVVLDGANSFDGSYMFFETMLNNFSVHNHSIIHQAIKICPNSIINENLDIRFRLFSDGFISAGKKYISETFSQIKNSVSRIQPSNNFDIIDFLEQSNRIRRFNMMGAALLRTKFEVRHPFFDHRVVDLVTGFPSIFRTKEKFILGLYLLRKNPYLASLKYERTGLPAHTKLSDHYISYAMRAARKELSKIFPSLKSSPRVSINYMHWIQTDKQLQEYIKSILLDPRSLQRDYLLSQDIEPFIMSMFAGHSSHMPIVFRLLSLELWQRYFLEGSSPPAAYFSS